MGNEDKYAQYPERPSDSRVRYFDGQFLGSQDFIDEQRYHIDRLRRLTGHLRVRGVTDGLGVSATGVLKLKIEPGTAIDERGRQLVLLAARDVTLPADIAKPAQHVLCLVFAQPTDRTMGGTGEQKGTRGDTRFRDDVTVSVYGLGKAAPEGSVALALLTIDAGGAVVVSTPVEVRAYSGLRLGGPGSPTLRTGGDPRPKDAVLAGNLRIQGSLSVADGIIQNGPTPIAGTSDLGLYSQADGKWMRFVTTGGSFAFFSDSGVGTSQVAELAGTGALTLNLRSNPLHISAACTGFADGASNRSEISNDVGTYKQLMVIGNSSGGAGRVVGVWDHLNVGGRLRVVTGISVGNPGATRALQIGGVENGVGMDASDVSPNAGYIRFGDNTGWRLHFARSKDSPGGALNQGPGAALMTVHDSGQVSVGTVNWSSETRLRLYGPSAQNQWIGRLVAGGDNSVVVAGEFNKQAYVGGHSPALNAWSDLILNAGGKVGVATTSLENASLTVQGVTVLRTGGANGWDRLVVTTTKEWGDGENQYITLGAGATGIMFSNPHVTWRDGRASIRYGRTGGVAGNTYWDAGVRGDGSFSFLPVDNNPVNTQELLRIDRGGFVTVGWRAPLRFSQVWTGFPDGNAAASEISNDIDGTKALMIVGNRSAGAERRVAMWDRVDVNGTLVVNNGPLVINQSGTGNGLRITNHTNRGVYLNITYEGGNDTVIFYNNNGLGNFMRADGVWQRNSDRALKHDITDMSDALELALKLRPVRYKWNATGTPCLGFIAQEVAPLFPEIVSETTRGEGDAARPVLGLKYDTFGVIAIAAVQQLKQQLEAKLAALDAQLRELAGVRAR